MPRRDTRASQTRSSFVDRVYGIRDRWLADPRFQRWAAAFPLTRGIARTRARALFDVCAGFVYSQILYACVKLGLFAQLTGGPRSAEFLAEALHVPLDSMTRLLEAAASLRLVERRSGERFGLGTLGASLIGNPGVAAMVEHHGLFYADLGDPVALLRGRQPTSLSRYWAYANSTAPRTLARVDVAEYSQLMSASQPLVAAEILDAYPVGRHRVLLDVGGGEGGFCIEAAARHPLLRVIAFDLPPIAATARGRFAHAGIVERAEAVGGDFLKDSLPGGADLATLVRVLHDHDDQNAARLLRSVHRALREDGVVLIGEPMASAGGNDPSGDAYFGFYLLAMGQGRPRSPQMLQTMLREAGFVEARVLATAVPLKTRIVIARKPRGPAPRSV
ncbi:MAG: methyltransferase domain-containing protein [Gammaproteobacteria bacterium]|nr:methyltransferase domain-containing protein [Gammaproteobacteria bacterium]